MIKSIYDWYLDRGLFLVPLEGRLKKHRVSYETLIKQHSRGKITAKYLQKMAKNGDNIGWLIGSPDPSMSHIAPGGQYIVLDVDMHAQKAGMKSLAAIEQKIGYSFAGKYPTIQSGEDGLHYYMRINTDRRLRKTNPKFPEIELLAAGLVVLPGSIHKKTGNQYQWAGGVEWEGDIPEAPSGLLDLYDAGPLYLDDADDDDRTIGHEELRILLDQIPIAEHRDHDSWWAIISAAAHATQGDPESLDVFLEWSLSDEDRLDAPPDINPVEISRRWGSIVKSGSRGRTLGTLIWAAKNFGGVGLDEFSANQRLADAKDLIAQNPIEDKTNDESYGHLVLWTKGKTPEPTNADNNIAVYLQRHPDFKGKLGYNTRSANCCLMCPSPFDWNEDEQYPKTIQSSDILRVVSWFATALKLNVSKERIEKLIRPICMDPYRSIQFDPFEDYLNSLKWDGTSRLDTFLIGAARVEDSAYMRDVSAKTLISAVARTYEPGCKVDTMPILVGPQGIGKSTLIRTLLPDPEYFSDHLPTLADKDAKAQIHGLVFLELGELDAFSRSDTTAIKNFVTVQVDRFRPPYGRAPENFPRTCIFIGTTNADDFLKDVTGARRFWPIEIEGHIDLNSVARDRDQLWAEAAVRYNTGERWWLSGDALTGQVDAAEKHREVGSYETKISTYLEKRAGEVGDADALICGKHPMYENGKRARITMNEILDSALMIPIDRQNRGVTTDAGRAMRALGWKKIRARGPKSERMHFYESPDLQRK